MDLTINSYDLLKSDIQAEIDSFTETITNKATEIMLDETIPIIERINKVKQLPTSATFEDVMKTAVKCYLFNNQLYAVPTVAGKQNNTSTRTVNMVPRFSVGTHIYYKTPDAESPIYELLADYNLKDIITGEIVKPSNVVCIMRNKPMGTQPGLSAPQWTVTE